MALTDKLTAIANAIRAKCGTSSKMTLAEMPNKIAAISTGNATEPYIEETYDESGWLISATPHGHTLVLRPSEALHSTAALVLHQ